MDKVLWAEPLTAEAFAPFGKVIEAKANSHRINDGHGERFSDLCQLEFRRQKGLPSVGIVRARPFEEPLFITKMEAHPHSSQSFIPLERRPFLVIVAPCGAFLPDEMKAFLAAGHQGIHYARGVWHHPLTALREGQEFLVIDGGGREDDLLLEKLDGPRVAYRLP